MKQALKQTNLQLVTIGIIIGIILILAHLQVSVLRAQTAACPTLPANTGSSTGTVNISEQGTYKVWTRMMAPNTKRNSYWLQIDDACGINVGDSDTITPNTWTWVAYEDGDTTQTITRDLAQGVHTIKLVGREPNVRVDNLVFAKDLSCVPVDTGANCAPDPPPPSTACTITGTTNAETISGTSGNDVICGGEGNDTIKSLAGNDTLRGEGGADTLLGGVGDDALDGGTGTDTASYSASLTAVTASLATNFSTGEGSDTFLGVENLLGSSIADSLTGSAANNKLTGGGGPDTLKGEDGDDAVDSKDGVKGNDSLDGGGGIDMKVTDATEKSIVNFP